MAMTSTPSWRTRKPLNFSIFNWMEVILLIIMVEYTTMIYDYEVRGTARPKRLQGKGCWCFAFTKEWETMQYAYDQNTMWATPNGMKKQTPTVMMYSDAKKMAIQYAKEHGFKVVWVLS
jgi:hypothetical protein